MKCPHCVVEIHPGFVSNAVNQGQSIGNENGRPHGFFAQAMTCPACHRAIINLLKRDTQSGNFGPPILVYPHKATRPHAPAEVPAALAEDFNEACLVVGDSPKASAALSRRCLQAMLHSQGFTQRDLAKAIDAALDSKTLPSALAENLDAIRNIGNFAAHPIKDTNSGAIVEVEEHEADWNLDVLEGLFDFYYVQPIKAAARKASLNAKLQGANKPPMK